MNTRDRLLALAEAWETWAAEASTLANVAEYDDDAKYLRAQASRAIEDATDLRNLANDLANDLAKETT